MFSEEKSNGIKGVYKPLDLLVIRDSTDSLCPDSLTPFFSQRAMAASQRANVVPDHSQPISQFPCDLWVLLDFFTFAGEGRFAVMTFSH